MDPFGIRRRIEEKKAKIEADRQYFFDLQRRVAEDDARIAHILREGIFEIWKDQYGRLQLAFPRRSPYDSPQYIGELIDKMAEWEQSTPQRSPHNVTTA